MLPLFTTAIHDFRIVGFFVLQHIQECDIDLKEIYMSVERLIIHRERETSRVVWSDSIQKLNYPQRKVFL